MEAPGFLNFDFRPYRLSGIVYGTLLNDPAALAALGDAVDRPPYEAAPKAPVLYLKPRNTLSATGATVATPEDPGEFLVGASLGLVIGRTACRVDEADALGHVTGLTLVADLHVPHDSFYRPSVRFRARDGSCLIGPRVVALAEAGVPDAIDITVSIDGRVGQKVSTAGMLRPAARLLTDVTEFMTLSPGDLLLLGVRAGAPRARAGQRFAVEAAGIGRLEGALA